MKWINKVIAVIVALTLVVGTVPTVKVMAATDNASLSNLGSLGTVEIGNKTESGTWYQTKVGGKAAFCMDLGLACQSGDIFESTTKTISSSSSNTKNALEARVGYWYDETRDANRKAWVYAQCLIWSIEEGYTSKSELTSVIRQVRSNTGYYDSKTAAELYTEIFGGDSTVTCEVTIWNYQGSGSSRQRLMRIEGSPREYEPDYVNATKRYRQRITLFKEDEDGNALPRVTFKLKANNIKELYAFKANGLGAAESGELEEGVSVFELVTQTDSKGKITYKFDYQLQSEDYAYIESSILENMTSAEKKAMRERLDDEGYKYADNLSKTGAEHLVERDIERQLDNIVNTYVLTEVDTGNGNLLLDPEWKTGKTITIRANQSWTKVNGDWPDSVDGSHGDYSLAYKLTIENKYKKARFQVTKKDDKTGWVVPEAVYGIYDDAACTNLLDRYVTDKNGQFTTKYYSTNKNLYIKEYEAPKGFLIDSTIYQINKDGLNFAAEYNTVELDMLETQSLAKITLAKTGEKLAGVDEDEDGNKKFRYDTKSLEDTDFVIYSAEDLISQEGTKLFSKDDIVATVTTGKDVEFTNLCGGICTYTVDENTGNVTLTLPLGKYRIKEVRASHGYLLGNEKEWNVYFRYRDDTSEYVYDLTENTDSNGVLNVNNDRVVTDVSLNKKSEVSSLPVKDAVFGFYTRTDIYNADGNVIVEAGEKIATVTTNEEGFAELPYNVPLMSEGYDADAEEENANVGLNSGDYYWKEESVSGSYYLDDKEIDVHLEYEDQKTAVITSETEITNTQTDVMVSKLKLAGSTELLNCDLRITDTNGNIIVCWTTGVPDSIGMNAVAEELGYRNLIATMDDKGNVTVKGLLHDQEYTLTETRPCNGYATAEDIIFKLVSGTNELGDVITEAYVKDSSGNFVKNSENKVLMYDDTTKIEFNKYASNTDTYLPGTKWQIKDKKGTVVYEFITGETSTLIEGVLIAGETYTFVEIETLDSYELSASFEYTVIDTGDVQKIEVTNQYKPGTIITSTPDEYRDGSLTSPKTGYDFMKILIALFVSIIMMLLSALGLKKSTNASKCFFFLLLMLAGFSMTENVNAAETVTEIVTYEANEPNQGVNVSKTKKIDGKKYKVDDIKYEVISEEVVTEEATTTITKVSDVVKKGESYSAEDTITENDIVYNLMNTTEEETVMEYRFEQSVTGWNDYTSEDAAKKAPLTKDVKVINEKTGMEQTVTCTQSGIEKLDATTWVDTYIDITFIAYDADSFIWNGKEIPNTENPLEGYEKELIESVGGTTDNYRVVRIEWDGDMYLNEDNVPCRNARASVQKKVPYWRVSYTGNIIEEEVVGVVYTSTYEGTQIKVTDKTNYTIKATITYEQDSMIINITIGIGIIILIILVVGILFIVKKKK